jgi:hypothetical protein
MASDLISIWKLIKQKIYIPAQYGNTMELSQHIFPITTPLDHLVQTARYDVQPQIMPGELKDALSQAVCNIFYKAHILKAYKPTVQETYKESSGK